LKDPIAETPQVPCSLGARARRAPNSPDVLTVSIIGAFENLPQIKAQPCVRPAGGEVEPPEDALRPDTIRIPSRAAKAHPQGRSVAEQAAGLARREHDGMRRKHTPKD
jgi:hypothetical protein